MGENRMLKHKKVALYISGGIAVYKTCELIRQLIKKGAEVKVAMTQSAAEFVSPLTFQILSKNKVYTDLFDESESDIVSHIHLADWADVALVVPATANLIAKMTCGIADDFVTTSLLASSAPIVIAPAMNTHMWHNPATVENCSTLVQRGVYIVEPDRGFLAEGYEGDGRLPELSRILEETETFMQRMNGTGQLENRHVLVTAGGTKEPIDPVRFITNKSSGKMGYALARAARNEGAKVTLITASDLPIPKGVHAIKVSTAEEMRSEVLKYFPETDVVLMAAAVSDYKPTVVAKQKIKKTSEQTLKLEKTVDILKELGNLKTTQFLVGFAAETENIKEYARKKLTEKKVDMIAANDVSQKTSGFDVDTNEVVLFSKNGEEQHIALAEKNQIAVDMIEAISKQLGKK